MRYYSAQSQPWITPLLFVMVFKPSFKSILAILLAASLTLAGCREAPDSGAVAKSVAAVSLAAIAVEAKGFDVGPKVSARTVYVFFDTQCPHCGALWEAAKPLKSQARFVWIPVGILNPSSTLQGATLLAAQDPVSAMNDHETSLQARQGGINAASSIDSQKALVAKNTQLFNRLGFASVPAIVGMNARTGAVITQEGAMSTAALAALLGLQVPVGDPVIPV